MKQCPKCITGRVLRAVDEHGNPDDACYQCGYRVPPAYLVPELRERLMTEKPPRVTHRGNRRVLI